MHCNSFDPCISSSFLRTFHQCPSLLSSSIDTDLDSTHQVSDDSSCHTPKRYKIHYGKSGRNISCNEDSSDVEETNEQDSSPSTTLGETSHHRSLKRIQFCFDEDMGTSMMEEDFCIDSLQYTGVSFPIMEVNNQQQPPTSLLKIPRITLSKIEATLDIQQKQEEMIQSMNDMWSKWKETMMNERAFPALEMEETMPYSLLEFESLLA